MKKMNNKGFSLVELIIVIAIMAVLVGVLAPQFLKYVEQSRVQKDESAMGEVNNAIKIACSVEKVYDALPETGLDIDFGHDGDRPVKIDTGNDELTDELEKSVPTIAKWSSKMYKGSTATTHVEIDADAMTVNVYTTNSANDTLTIR